MAAIPTWQLFGESTERPDVLHCETIASRSSLHDWELAPHRHARLHQLLLLRRGAGQVRLDGLSRPLGPMTWVNVPAGTVHALSFRPGTEGWVATLPDELVQALLQGHAAERRTLAEPGTAPADAAAVRALRETAAEFEARGAARALVLRGLAAILLGLAARALQAMAPKPPGQDGSNLVQRFLVQIEQHLHERWTVARHARELAVSPTHLSRLARAATGRNASSLIEERLVREARRHLLYTTLQVATIAESLGFDDPAHFSRVFRRSTGLSPTALREAQGRPGPHPARRRADRAGAG